MTKSLLSGQLNALLQAVLSEKLLVGFGLQGCAFCSELQSTMLYLLNVLPDQPLHESWLVNDKDYSFLWIECKSDSESNSMGLNIRVFPTLVAFNSKVPVLGWEGFADQNLSSDRTKMLEAAIQAVQALPPKTSSGSFDQ